MSAPQPLHITGTVFVYACLVLVLVALLAAAGGVALSLRATASEFETSEKLITAKNDLLQCNHQLARLDGRVSTFEGLLLHPHRAALEASLRLFLAERNSAPHELTIEEYGLWLKQRK